MTCAAGIGDGVDGVFRWELVTGKVVWGVATIVSAMCYTSGDHPYLSGRLGFVGITASHGVGARGCRFVSSGLSVA